MLPMLLMAGASFLGGLAKKKAGDSAAASERAAAANAKISSFFKDRILRRSQEELQSTIRARTGAAGLDVNQGSPLEAYLQATRETQLDIIHNQTNADSEYGAHLESANIAQRTGNLAMAASLVEGGAGMVGAKSKASQRLKLQDLLAG